MSLIISNVMGHFDPYMDNDLFMINWAGPQENLANVKENTVIMRTADDEKYRCIVPDGKNDPDHMSSDHNSALSPHELMYSLFTQTSCSYRIESYWTYELCHGKHLKQYHESKELGLKKPKVQVYFLGKSILSEEANKKGNFEMKYRKIDGIELPYYEVNMTDGTHCELKDQPRRAHVMYICQPEGRGEVYELKEMSTCEYDVIVLTSVLCAHPAFKPKDAPVTQIQCQAIDGSPHKPRQLETMEEEEKKTGVSKEVPVTSLMPTEIDEEEKPSVEVSPPQGIRQQAQKPRPDVISAITDKQLMHDFLSGDHCLKGGAGWWKYEFCFGKYARQYHDDQDGRTVVYIGHWDEKAHLAWLELSPFKRPKETLKRKYIANYYSKGDICDLTGNHRFAEVRLKCNENSNSPHAVSIYMTEPKPCEYVLVVESPILCTLMDKVDDYGLIKNSERESEAEKIESNLDPKQFESTFSYTVKKRENMEQTQRKLLKQNQFSSGENEKKVPEVTVKYSEMSVVDKHLVDDFLDGNHCLEGGGGWWKYEFCFGKYVKQFHQIEIAERGHSECDLDLEAILFNLPVTHTFCQILVPGLIKLFEKRLRQDSVMITFGLRV
ncbi:hypothetical protein ScPMuIL_014818 [Solemya velum]